jgi:hypothetical protein
MASDPSPPAESSGGSLAPLDRAALERVLARATELQARLADTPDELTEKELLELGNEVGISADHLRQALAEERTRVVLPEETGVVGSWFGSTMAGASRVVRGKPAEVLATIDQWMQRQECSAYGGASESDSRGKRVAISWAVCRRASTSAAGRMH